MTHRDSGVQIKLVTRRLTAVLIAATNVQGRRLKDQGYSISRNVSAVKTLSQKRIDLKLGENYLSAHRIT